jgi:PAS domain S-box-containing protein
MSSRWKLLRGSVAQKGVLIVGLPLFLQLTFLIAITVENAKLDTEAINEAHYRRLLTAVSELVLYSFDAFGNFSKYMYTQDKSQLLRVERMDQVDRVVGVIQSEIANDPSAASFKGLLSIAHESSSMVRQAREILAGRLSIDDACTLFEYRTRIMKLIPKFVEEQRQVLALSRRLADVSSDEQVKARQKERFLIVAAALTSSLFAIFAGTIFSGGIRSRLNVIKDNTVLLRNEAPLKPPVGGDDEIQQLDQAFREMASALTLAKDQERALVTESKDMICSLDGETRIILANPAACDFLGLASGTGGPLLQDFVASSEDREAIMVALADSKNTGIPRVVEFALNPGSGGERAFSATINWSQTQRKYYMVAHDITTRKELEKLRREIFAMIAHDIRSPLLSVESAIEAVLAGNDVADDSRNRDRLRSSNRNLSMVTGLISDLLDVQKFQSGKFDICPTRVDAGEILDKAVDSVQQLIEVKSLTIVRQCFDPVSLLADRDLLVRVLTNLLNNAIKYSPNGGQIEVSLTHRSAQARFAVRDHGPGIPAEDQHRLFQSFSQTRAPAQDVQRSSGLGLAICKMIVEEHDGKIGVTSTVGQGSEFWFSIPTIES